MDMTRETAEKNLNLAGVSVEQILKAVEHYVHLGSNSSNISWSDFQFRTFEGEPPESKDTVTDLVNKGMRFIDAIYYQCAISKGVEVVVTADIKKNENPVSWVKIANALHAWYFSIITQGRAVANGQCKFLKEVMGFGSGWADAINGLCSASIEKVPKRWVKDVALDKLSEQSRNRLALGLAGHRYIASLKYIRPQDFKEGATQGAETVRRILAWTKRSCWWDLHPSFRETSVISHFGSLNKAICELLLDSVKPEALERLARSKVLFEVPQSDPQYSNWHGAFSSNLPELKYQF